MADAMEALVAKITRELLEQTGGAPAPAAPAGRFTAADYPLLEKHPEVVRTPTGKPMEAITMEAVRSGAITGEDLRISRDMLLCQADVAESAGKKQMAENLRRAAEMTAVPDDKVIEMYDLLRPNRATKAQLEQMAATLENDYGAAMCAAWCGKRWRFMRNGAFCSPADRKVVETWHVPGAWWRASTSAIPPPRPSCWKSWTATAAIWPAP